MEEDRVAQFKSVFRSPDANNEELSPPSGFHCASNGNLILADDFNHRIQIYDADQNLKKSFGRKGKNPGEFHYPKGITTDRGGNIYVADSWNHRVQKFDAQGNHLLSIGSSGEGKDQLNEPYDVFIAPNTNILIVERYNHRIQIFSPEGKSLGWIGGRGTVLEEQLASIYETPKSLFNAPAFEFPTSIASDRHGNYFISDSGNHRILKFDAQWNLTQAFGERGKNPGQFEYPLSVSVGPNDLLYVADLNAVRRFPYSLMREVPTGPGQDVTAPGALGGTNGHRTRGLVFGPDGRFYVTVGSASNIAIEAEPRATVQVFAEDGTDQATFASGLRNPVGIDFQPETGELYVVVAERDGMGEELVPDFLTRIREGEFFGWPFAYVGPNPQPGFGEKRPDLVAVSREPDILFQAHSTSLGLVFYDGSSFPQTYRGDAFVALRGSFNAAEPRGYMVVRVPFEKGRPMGYYEAFATGFWVSGERTADVVGRPVGLAVARDGSLLVADDVGNRIWRISYGG